MKNAEWFACLFILLGVVGVTLIVFGFPSSFDGKIEGLDALIARVDEAAAEGRVAAGMETSECQPSTPLLIGAVARDFLRGMPVVECNSALWPEAPLAKPLAIVDLDRQRLDKINDDLPAPLRATSLDTAATIVFTHCSKTKSGSYGFFRDAYKQYCGLLFVLQDGPTRMRILGIQPFISAPPERIDLRFTFGSVVAPRPDSRMQDAIVFLSRR